ncbi:Octanoyltransferase LipM [Myxococcaceae bacterium]|nr:Octanoyltransferase LipM [Myxococcaceae bacterium]
MSRAPLRWLDEGAADGRWNMAVDETLLLALEEDGAPTLRLYAWRGPWLSLGHAQALDPLREAACRDVGVGIVRRPTGGSAVLHGADLTYALVAPESAVPAGLEASYAWVGRVLREALDRVGVVADPPAGRSAGRREQPFDCFARVGIEEITVAGRKLVGSAQRRIRGRILQHGSIRLGPDPPPAAAAAGRLAGVATSLAELGFEPPENRLRDACVQAFAAAFDLPIDRSSLTEPERARAAERARGPAGNPRVGRRDPGAGASRPPSAGR